MLHFCISNEEQIKKKANDLTHDGVTGILNCLRNGPSTRAVPSLTERPKCRDSNMPTWSDRAETSDWWLLHHTCQGLQITVLPSFWWVFCWIYSVCPAILSVLKRVIQSGRYDNLNPMNPSSRQIIIPAGMLFILKMSTS